MLALLYGQAGPEAAVMSDQRDQLMTGDNRSQHQSGDDTDLRYATWHSPTLPGRASLLRGVALRVLVPTRSPAAISARTEPKTRVETGPNYVSGAGGHCRPQPEPHSGRCDLQ